MKRIFAVLCAVALLFAASGCRNKGTGDVSVSVTEAQGVAEFAPEPSPVAVSTANYSLTRAEFTYLFYMNYNEHIGKSNIVGAATGIDTSKSLKEQTLSDGTTWFDFLVGTALSSAKDMLVLCEGALEANISLDEDDTAELESYITGLEERAAGAGQATDEYLAGIFGDEVNADVIREIYRKSLLADKYYGIISSGIVVSEDECAKYLEENRRTLMKTDYMVYTFTVGDMPENTADAVRENAMLLSKITDSGDFEEFIRENVSETGGDGEAFDMSSVTVTGGAYSASDSYCAWAYRQTEAGVTYMQSDAAAGKYTVYLLTRAPYLDEYTTKNARLLMFSTEQYGGADLAGAAAVTALEEFRALGADTSAFTQIAATYPPQSDEGMADGRLCGSLRKNDTDRHIAQWLYSDERTVGDADAINTNNGYCIAYYESDGEYVAAYREEIEGILYERAKNVALDELAERFPVSSDANVILDITA